MNNCIKVGAVLLALCCVPARADASDGATAPAEAAQGVKAISPSPGIESFDKAAAKARYDHWYKMFLADMRVLAKEVRNGESPDISRVNQIFSHSVVPDSHMTMLLVAQAKDPRTFETSRTDPPVMGWAPIMLALLDNASPAGQGGPYHRKDMLPSDEGSFVWYIEVHSDSSISGVFQDRQIFKSYHLPPNGVLERNAYPFINFREKDGAIYCTGFSGELVNLVSTVSRMQLY